MAKMNQGILGGLSGKIGNVVGSSWKGVNVLRSLPVTVANPNTSAQQTQRGKFGQAVADAQVLLAGWIKPLWDRFVQKQSGYNAWIGANIDQFSDTGLSSPGNLTMARGSLAKPGLSNESPSTSPDVVDVDIDFDNSQLTSGDVFAAPYNETQDVWGTPYNPGSTSNGTTISVPVDDMAKSSGDTIRVFVAYKSADGRQVSDAQNVTVSWP